MFELIIIITILIALVLASLQDIKTREVPDLLSGGLIATGVVLRIMASVNYQDWSFIIEGIYGLIFTVIFSLLMFYTGQWGGGDSKLLMGIGVLIGMPLTFQNDLLAFIINIFLMGAIWGFGYAIMIILRNKKHFSKTFVKELEKKAIHKKIVIFSGVIIAIIAFLTEFTIPLLLIAGIIPLTFYLWLATSVMEKHYMIKWYPISKLTEGDWIQEIVKVKGKIIAGPKDLGISKKQIALLKKLKIAKVKVKEGIPFVPSFLLGYIAFLLGLNIFALF